MFLPLPLLPSIFPQNTNFFTSNLLLRLPHQFNIFFMILTIDLITFLAVNILAIHFLENKTVKKWPLTGIKVCSDPTIDNRPVNLETRSTWETS